MKGILKKILLTLLAALIIIQFIHPKKNKAEGPQPNYIGNTFAIPGDIKTIMTKACAVVQAVVVCGWKKRSASEST